jgi:hypothetical protein
MLVTGHSIVGHKVHLNPAVVPVKEVARNTPRKAIGCRGRVVSSCETVERKGIKWSLVVTSLLIYTTFAFVLYSYLLDSRISSLLKSFNSGGRVPSKLFSESDKVRKFENRAILTGP